MNRSSPIRSRLSPVQPLLGRCGPSAIGRLVVAVVVNSVNRMARGWTSPHIEQEGLVGIAPLITDGYSTSAIVRKLFVGFVQAATSQTDPCPVLRCGFAVLRCIAVASAWKTGHSTFSAEASATACLLSSERITKGGALIAAVATATPANTSPDCIRSFNYCEASDAIA